jgi:phosphoserine aminotransferase
MARRNEEKAKLIYDVIDASSFWKGHARPDSRSLMNITFRTPSEELDNAFLAEAQAAGMDQLKGHRSTGGVRASVYNAFPRAGCEAIASLMKDFERRKS